METLILLLKDFFLCVVCVVASWIVSDNDVENKS